MLSRTTVALVLVLAAALGSAAVVTDLDASQVPGASTPGSDGADGTDSTPTATESGTASAVQFDFTVREITECGRTCRDVTAALQNRGEANATDVVVRTELYTDGDRIWEDEESVGTIAAGEEYETTKRVELGYGGALKVQNNDGQVTIRVTVRHADGVQRFERNETVG